MGYYITKAELKNEFSNLQRSKMNKATELQKLNMLSSCTVNFLMHYMEQFS